MSKLLLANKVALVTGAGSGIGRAVALRFAEEGARVVAVSHVPEHLSESVQEIALAGGTAVPIVADVSTSTGVQQAVNIAIERFGGLHVMFNGSGGSERPTGDGPVDRCTEEGWDATLAVNLRSVFLCCKYGVQAMIASGGGSIVNLSSVLGLVGCDEHFATHAYAAAEAGVIGLTRAVAVYYAPQGVRCNAICPGPIASNSLPDAQDGTGAGMAEEMRWKQPLAGRLGTPEETTGAALFLASDESRFVTGVILPVDAGWTAQ